VLEVELRVDIARLVTLKSIKLRTDNMFKWRKLGKAFTPQDVGGRACEGVFQAPATLIFERFVRVYFSCRPPPDENGHMLAIPLMSISIVQSIQDSAC